MANFLHTATNAFFKRVYAPGVRDQFSHTTPGLGFLKKTGRSAWGGQGVYLDARTQRNPGYRPTNAGNQAAAFPTSMSSAHSNLVVSCVLHHGTGGISALAAAASASSDAAFADALKDQVQLHMKDSKQQLEYDFYRGGTGILARLNGNPADGATTITLEQADEAQVIYWRGEGNRAFLPTQEIEIWNEAGTVRRTTNAATGTLTFFTVTSVSAANHTQINLTAVHDDVADGDLVLRRGTHNAAGAGAEPVQALAGLEQLIGDVSDTGAAGVSLGFEPDILEGVDRNADAWARGYVNSLAGAELARDTLNFAIRSCERRADMPVELLLTPDDIQLQLVDLMVGDQRYQPQVFPGGFKADALVWNAGNHNVAVLSTRHCPHGRLYMLNFDCVEFFSLVDFEVIETDGGMLRQDPAGGDVWNWTWRMFGNMGTRQPNGLGKLIRVGTDPDHLNNAGRFFDF